MRSRTKPRRLLPFIERAGMFVSGEVANGEEYEAIGRVTIIRWGPFVVEIFTGRTDR